MIEFSTYEIIQVREALRIALTRARRDLEEVSLPGFALFHKDRVTALETALAKVIEVSGD